MCLIFNWCVVSLCCDIIQMSVINVGNKQWMFCMLIDVEDCCNLLVSYFLCCSYFVCFIFYCLMYCQCDVCVGLGNVFVQYQYCIVRFDFVQSRSINVVFMQYFQCQLQMFLFIVSDIGVEVFFVYQFMQCKVVFYVGVWRINVDYFF